MRERTIVLIELLFDPEFEAIGCLVRAGRQDLDLRDSTICQEPVNAHHQLVVEGEPGDEVFRWDDAIVFVELLGAEDATCL